MTWLTATVVQAAGEGARLMFSAGRERFACDLDRAGTVGLIDGLLKALWAKRSGYRMPVSRLRITGDSARTNGPRPLLIDGPQGQLIALEMMWEQVAELAELARGMLMMSGPSTPAA